MKKLIVAVLVSGIIATPFLVTSKAEEVSDYTTVYDCKWLDNDESLEADSEADISAVCIETVYDGDKVIETNEYYVSDLLVADNAAIVKELADSHFSVKPKEEGTITLSAVFDIDDNTNISIKRDVKVEG